MRKRIIAGNWKMYKTVEEAKQFMTQIHNQLPDTSQVESVICAPALHLTQLVEMTDDSPLSIGAQTMHSEKEGAFTGEISPYMLQTAGVQFVIIGHSERRLYFHETDEVVNQKVQAAFAYNLIPIICVGESLEEREAGRTFQRVTAQVKQALLNVGRTDAARAIIAYEPIWAIGTGKTATANDANEVCGEIRRMLTTMYDAETAERVRIQYGGSVKPSNIAELLAKPHIDGALVGGASLDPASFLQIVEAGTDAK